VRGFGFRGGWDDGTKSGKGSKTWEEETDDLISDKTEVSGAVGGKRSALLVMSLMASVEHPCTEHSVSLIGWLIGCFACDFGLA
jgi:hypothetical protein